MQLELSEPVALLLNEPPSVSDAAAEYGFRYFTSFAALRTYVEDEVIASDDTSGTEAASMFA